jgi:hypothetical protein
MNLKSFNRYKTQCPVCHSNLVSLIDIDIMTKRKYASWKRADIDYLGTLQFVELQCDPLYYSKVHKSFNKEDKFAKSVIDDVFSAAADHFSLRRVGLPAFGITKIKQSLAKTDRSIYMADISLSRRCIELEPEIEHNYFITTPPMDEISNKMSIDAEGLHIFDITIENHFDQKTNKPTETVVWYADGKEQFGHQINLPVIPSENFDFTSRDNLSNYIDACAILI